ncbi:MAG: LptF/LptG family permease, partial [Pseudomonadota bacterium]
MAGRPARLVTRLLVTRGARWTAVAALALALLALLVDWVELGARGGAPVGQTLVEAALRVPAHLGQAAPLVAALGAALALTGLRRAGEWQALEGVGVGPWGRLGPLLALGWGLGAAAAAVDAWLTPWAGLARSNLAALQRGEPLRAAGSVWLALDDTLYELRGEPGDGNIEGARAFALSAGHLRAAWEADGLRWDGARWVPEPVGLTLEPWASLPAPPALAELVGTTPMPERTWTALGADAGPAAAAERATRWSRALVCGPAAVVG